MVNLALNVRFWPVLLIVLMLLESDRLLSSLLGINLVVASWAYSGFMLGALLIALLRVMLVESGVQIKSFYYPVGVVALMFLVSAVSGLFIFPKPISDWLPAQFIFFPILIFYFFYLCRATLKEVAVGFVCVAILVSVLLLIDQIKPLAFLDSFQRFSTFQGYGARRLVLLKNEVIFGFVIVASAVISDVCTGARRYILIGIALLIFFVQALIMESRMGFLAMAVAVVALLKMRGLTPKIVRILAALLLSIVFILPVVFEKHIEKMGQLSIQDGEANVSIRIESVAHMLDLYWRSNGWGVGIMSSTGTINNVLYEDERYNMADAGAASALTQFGLGGLFVWLFLTYKCVTTCSTTYRLSGRRDYAASAVSAFLLGFTITLLPLSLFTQAWTISVGGALLYMLWVCQNANRGHVINNFSQRSLVQGCVK